MAHRRATQFIMAPIAPYGYKKTYYPCITKLFHFRGNAVALPLLLGIIMPCHCVPHSRNWGSCLEDSPPTLDYSFPELPPGAMYDASHQCRLNFGPAATDCTGIQVGLTGIQVGLTGIQVGLTGIQVGLTGIQVGMTGIQVGLTGIQVGLTGK